MAAPLLTPAEWSERWQALKDHLKQEIDADARIFDGMPHDTPGRGGIGGLLSANRNTLAKMRDLEAGR